MFMRYYMLNWKRLVQWLSVCAGNVKDLGSSPRSGNFHNIFQYSFLCRHALKDHHTPSSSIHPRACLEPNQRQGFKKRNKLQSTHHMESGKVHKAMLIGPDLLNLYLLNWGLHPTLVCQFYLFFSYLFNYYFIVLLF